MTVHDQHASRRELLHLIASFRAAIVKCKCCDNQRAVRLWVLAELLPASILLLMRGSLAQLGQTICGPLQPGVLRIPVFDEPHRRAFGIFTVTCMMRHYVSSFLNHSQGASESAPQTRSLRGGLPWMSARVARPAWFRAAIVRGKSCYGKPRAI